ncbi:MAG: ribonuclease III [Bdellovibrionaceae bacterium]|nr:ribonuclease III [Pseudobdellovibrionaceae bacterium]
MRGEVLDIIEEKVGYKFNKSELLLRALTHKSYYNEHLGSKTESVSDHNEKLEFLGDAVLDLVLSDELMKRHVQIDEGGLSKIRASLVNEVTLSEIALEFKFDELIKLGKGEQKTDGNKKPRLLASVFESFVGALYLDAGFDKAKEILVKTFNSRFEDIDFEHHYTLDFKTRLQEKVQEVFRKTPVYEVIDEKGPDHKKEFMVQVKVGTQVLASGKGLSKKQAAQEAAEKALQEL